MLVVRKIRTLQAIVQEAKEDGKLVGFTPTMGALHEGHFSLVGRSIEECGLSICSIFVNPTQFNESSDLDKYPRTFESDCDGLRNIGCDIVFAPSVEEMYPDGQKSNVDIDLQGLDLMMEGGMRPGHFEGVVQVVKLLVDITDCDRLYMGQKDFQQFTIIGHMLRELKYDAQLVVCDILRADDGLALSSRNVRLTAAHREQASILNKTLTWAKENIENKSINEIQNLAMQTMDIPGFRPEYFDIVNGINLKPVAHSEDAEILVACTAVWAGDVRLIDNMILKGKL